MFTNVKNRISNFKNTKPNQFEVAKSALIMATGMVITVGAIHAINEWDQTIPTED